MRLKLLLNYNFFYNDQFHILGVLHRNFLLTWKFWWEKVVLCIRIVVPNEVIVVVTVVVTSEIDCKRLAVIDVLAVVCLTVITGMLYEVVARLGVFTLRSKSTLRRMPSACIASTSWHRTLGLLIFLTVMSDGKLLLLMGSDCRVESTIVICSIIVIVSKNGKTLMSSQNTDLPTQSQ